MATTSDVVDSVQAKIISRFVMPIVGTIVVGAVGYIVNDFSNSIKTVTSDVKTTVSAVQSHGAKLDVLAATTDARNAESSRRMDWFRSEFDRIDARLRSVETKK